MVVCAVGLQVQQTMEEAGLPRKSTETNSSSVTSRIPFMGPAAAFLKAHFQVASLDGFGLSAAPDATAAAGAALRYLKATQKTPAGHVDRLSLLRPDGYLVLGAAETVLGLTNNFRPIPDKRALYGPNPAQLHAAGGLQPFAAAAGNAR